MIDRIFSQQTFERVMATILVIVAVMGVILLALLIMSTANLGACQ